MSAHRRVLQAAGFLAAILCTPAAANAQTLRVGLTSEPTATDPHYHDLAPNNALSRHVFDALTSSDPLQKIRPGLATSWEARDDRTWAFRLREGVRFSNGEPFTAQDVIFSFCRILHNETSVGGNAFHEHVKNMAKVEAEGANTLVITTRKPEPLLPNHLGSLGIVTRSVVKAGELAFDPAAGCGVTQPWPTVSGFNDGSAAIGTGPFKLKSYVKGSAVELVRNEGYWGEKPAWSEVRLVAVPNAGPRLAGLLAGDFDLIENPASRDLGRLKDDARFRYIVTPSTRVIFLQLDVARDRSPQMRTENGNPFKDPRVRLAVSKAIDRKAIAARIMDNTATPASQFLPVGMPGAQPSPAALDYDPKAARALLAEAGYPNGFGVTLTATNDRYINDAQIAQAIAGFLTQVGIKTEVDAMTRSIFFTRRAKLEFTFAMGGWGSTTGEASSFLRQWAPTRDDKAGLGLSNFGGYSDPAFDQVITKAIATVDDIEREALLQEAGRLLLAKLPLIPIHFESTIWAFRSGLTYEGRADQYTLAMSAKPSR